MKRLVVFSGHPGTGKTTLSKMYADKVGAIWLSVDPIEGAMKLSGLENNPQLRTAAYDVARVIADQNLAAGRLVVIDGVNSTEQRRELWRKLAEKHAIKPEFVECVIREQKVHKQRVENRVRNIPGMKETSWERVQFWMIGYQPWTDERIVLSTDKTLDESFAELLSLLLR